MYIKTMFDVYVNVDRISHVYRTFEVEGVYKVYINLSPDYIITFWEFDNREEAEHCVKQLADHISDIVAYYDTERKMFMREE